MYNVLISRQTAEARLRVNMNLQMSWLASLIVPTAHSPQPTAHSPQPTAAFKNLG